MAQTPLVTVQGFLRDHLRECGAKSEKDCPTFDAELIHWIAAGINYGQRVQREQPEIGVGFSPSPAVSVWRILY